ncbi:MAG: gamma-glutamyl-gamma-aminobutyrate hydrolase family protein [Deltaproteobacteria bacterium]|nr:gamma-glutamyl-gamma-aminobutyrate hydrolase family protein [Deltaproteobacteria bacterium]MBW2420316.1 gamma-glutamyl-gamma-aminobutyrate hydrolase family protein [Deltaproteobacteria bacterium]
MPAPIIGLTAYGRGEEQRFDLPAEYVDAVRHAGGVAVLLPPGEAKPRAWLAALDGLILAGGGDLDPRSWDGPQVETTYGVDADRDANELELALAAIEDEIPTLCICRGLQVLNVALGGSLHAHLPDVVGEDVLHRLPPRVPTPHAVSVDPGCRLAAILEAEEIEAVSWHHQAVDRLGRGLEVVARAPDGVVEAVELADQPRLVAVQWHPELSAKHDPIQQRLFDWLVTTSRADECG